MAARDTANDTTTVLPITPSSSGQDSEETNSILAEALVESAPTVRIRTIFQRFWPDTKGFRGKLALSLLLVGVPPALAAAGIWMFKILVDEILTTRDVARFPLIAGAFVAITLLEGLVGFIDEYLNAWIAERFVLTLRTRVFNHLQQLSLSFFEKRQLGDILSRLTGDVSAIEQLLLSGVNQALTYLFQIIFYAGALFVLDWRLALAALAGAPVFLLLGKFFARRIKEASREQRRRSGSISAVAEESLHNAALVQAYHRQEHEAARFHRESLGSFTAQMLATKLEALFSPFTDLLEAIGVLFVIGLGLHELVQGRLTLGGLLVFIGYLTQLYGPVTGFADLTNSIFAASAGAERIIEILDTEPEVRDPANPVPIGRARGAVRVNQLSFRYPDSGRPALDQVSFTAAPGETIAVVGASGAGKSTLMRLLLRLHDPDSGSITLDGVDLRQLRLGELRGNIAAVLQETLVFDGTVEENIRWGKPDATQEEVVRAAKAADAHQFISGLPNGYHTRIGQRGMMLSGGQRQRIALARAMIRNAPVLLLDEPTTGLDAVSTQRVMEPLRRAMTGRTTIVISHNLLTVTEVDRILYLERGRVAGYGTHRELMANSPGYAELYRMNHLAAFQRGPMPPRPTRQAGPRALPPRPSPQARPRPAPPRPMPPARPRPTPQGRPEPARPTPLRARPEPNRAEGHPVSRPEPGRPSSRPEPVRPSPRPGPAPRPEPRPAQPEMPRPAPGSRLTPYARPSQPLPHPTPNGKQAPLSSPSSRPTSQPTQPPRATPATRPADRVTPKPTPIKRAQPTPNSEPRPLPAALSIPQPRPASSPQRARPLRWPSGDEPYKGRKSTEP